MSWHDDDLNDIYDKTEGYCFHCEKKLAFTNYGRPDRRGSWVVDHGRPLARNGHPTHLNNTHPSCYPCNEDKGVRRTGRF
jgi:5-methylcytosine-specific restriction endonuclease McrA